jgi:hypothetical protein
LRNAVSNVRANQPLKPQIQHARPVNADDAFSVDPALATSAARRKTRDGFGDSLLSVD